MRRLWALLTAPRSLRVDRLVCPHGEVSMTVEATAFYRSIKIEYSSGE